MQIDSEEREIQIKIQNEMCSIDSEEIYREKERDIMRNIDIL